MTISEIILIAGTGVALGVGIGLLLADKFADAEPGCLSSYEVLS